MSNGGSNFLIYAFERISAGKWNGISLKKKKKKRNDKRNYTCCVDIDIQTKRIKCENDSWRFRKDKINWNEQVL